MQVTYRLLRRMRTAWFTGKVCGARDAMDSANSMFRLRGGSDSIQALRNASARAGQGNMGPFKTPLSHGKSTAAPPVVVHTAYVPLDHGCSLFGRKFDGSAAGPLLLLARDCDHGLGFDTSCVLNPPQGESLQQRIAQYQQVCALAFTHPLVRQFVLCSRIALSWCSVTTLVYHWSVSLVNIAFVGFRCVLHP